MEIGQVIRKYRKEKNMTQEEMARRLGVTAPAANKWESGASAPDIALLAPIARMLGITTDTLLCFREALTEEEVRRFVQEADRRLQKEEIPAGAVPQLPQPDLAAGASAGRASPGEGDSGGGGAV